MESSLSDIADSISQQTNFDTELNKETAIQNLEELSSVEGECSETRFSLESQDIDSNHGPLSSGSTEFIQENFQEMGIDNNWQDEPFPSSSADFPLPSPLNELPQFSGTEQPESSSSALSNDRQIVVYQPPGQVAKENVMAGCCGLRNLGNTCFMSAGLQCLSATPAIVRYFLSEMVTPLQSQDGATCSQQEAGASGSSVTTALGDAQRNLTMNFSRLLAQMWEGNSSTVSPHFFKKSLANTHTQFKDHHQHDCQEFLALLLDTLHEQLNSAGRKDNVITREIVAEEKDDTLAVAGCSRSEETVPQNTTPTRASNIEQAELLLMQQSQPREKNCVEQSRSPPPCPPVPCSAPCIPGLTLNIKDMLKKEAKTSNVNVLAPQHMEPRPNNQIKFDSEKFGPNRHPHNMSAGAPSRGIRNLVSGRLSDPLVETPNNLSECSGKDGTGKRLKQTNLLGQPVAGHPATASSIRETEHEACANSNKRLKLVSHIKNKEEITSVEMTSLHEEVDVEFGDCASQHLEAEAHWQQHLAANKSIIADSFQGQFRSTVVCSVCRHISVTFEPFMYLSVPLPHAMELQIPVIYVPSNTSETLVRYLVCLNKYSSVRDLRAATLKLAGRDPNSDVIMCEGFDHHMSRTLDLECQLKMLKDNGRNIYAVEMLPVAQQQQDGDAMEVSEAMDLTPNTEEGLPKCNICLDEIELSAKPLRHGKVCECVLCKNCLEECTNHQHKSGSELKCPVCSLSVVPADFIVIEPGSSICKPVIRVLQVPVVFRIDSEGEQFNNKRSIRLYGEPRIIRLPSKVTGAHLYHALSTYAPTNDFSILLVCGTGLACSRCMFNSHCTGCVIEPSSTAVLLQTHDTLAVRVLLPDGNTDPPCHVLDHESMRLRRKSDPLSLYDCLQAFTKSETLDEQNPWFCPKCKQNQCATKTLSVWRYPDIVIVYLKRFVFHNNESKKLDDKVTFPVTGLTLQTRRGAGKTTDHIYNLYSCVCHFGRLSSGHYTAYSKHLRSTEWFYYDDEEVTRQRPKEDDFSTAYVLFYQREHMPELII